MLREFQKWWRQQPEGVRTPIVLIAMLLTIVFGGLLLVWAASWTIELMPWPWMTEGSE